MATGQKVELVVIVGPTASGKSALAMAIAKHFNGEIIAADSRTIYKGMDIGSAKPSSADRRQVPHWGLDLAEPNEQYSVAKYKEYAIEKISEIKARGRLPILVGGTGLYVDAVIFDFSFVSSEVAERHELESKNEMELQTIIKQRGYEMPKNMKNKRHLIRTIERRGHQGQSRHEPLSGDLLIGLMPSEKALKESIDQRAETMFKSGVVNEADKLLKQYGKPTLLKTGGIVYKICADMLEGKYDQPTAKELFKKADWQYARRQRTWFKRNKFIQWHNNPEAAFLSVKNLLNNKIG